jgi:hypothetical protein
VTLAPLSTTGIGSLPYTDVEEGLASAFRLDIPYLPQLPMRDPREFMLAQTLEGMPGIIVEEQGSILFDPDAWKKGRARWDDALYEATQNDAVSPFLPTPDYVASWAPFLARVAAERKPLAKVQLAGPMTLEWTLRSADGQLPPAGALEHVGRTILVRSMAMVDAVKAAGAEPIIFLDEPGLYAFSRQQPHHIVMLQQLRINVMALKKRGARVGLHCCSDADWGALIGLGADFVAIDVQLSLPSLLKAGEALVTWVAMGGRLALGVIPTATREAPLTAEQLLADMAQQLGKLEQYFPTRASIFENILLRSLLTPACGLAFLTPADAGAVIDELVRFKGLYGKVKARSWGARR